MRPRRGPTALALAAAVLGLALARRPAPAAPPEPGRPVTYAADVAPLFERLGCASARCHGGTGGRGGLRLSLFGADPELDHDALARADKGRRLNLVEPRKCLLLEKLDGALPHQGGAPLSPGSADHALLLAWLEQGARPGDAREARPLAVAASPELFRLKPGEGLPLRLKARLKEGSERDVTRLASFSSLDPDVATVDSDGFVSARRFGETHLVASYGRQSALVRVLVPQSLQGGFPEVAPAGKIDELVLAKLREIGLPPSSTASDEVFLRRVFLDVIGILPTPDEARAFLVDRDVEKRPKLVNALLERDEFNDNWALKWGDLLRIKSEYPVRVWPKGVAAYAHFVRESIATNKPYDQLVRELLVSTGSNFRDGEANYYRAVPSKDPQTFAETTALLFMGARLACVRCHAHPVEGWTLQDDLGMAAFFGNVRFKATGEWKEEIVFTDPDAVYRHPRTKEVLKPKFLGGDAVELQPGEDPRVRFAAWLTAPGNPWFARNIANRVWYWLMGRGIVHEPDDLRRTNPPSNPALLDYLARELVEHKYDLKHLYRLVLTSRTYQASSETTAANEHDSTHFSHYLARRLGAEALLDALSQVTETTETFASQVPEPYTRLVDTRAVTLTDGSVTHPFLELFGRPTRDTPFESERSNEVSMRQALQLLNSSDIERKVAASGRLRRLVQQKKSDEQILEELTLAAFSRFPTDGEKKRLLELVSKDKNQRPQALQDLLWAIVNAKEFLLNH